MNINGNTVGHPLPDPRKGMTMSGPINMNGQALSGIKVPVNDGDAVNWGSVKEFGKAKAGFIYPLAASVVPEGFLLCDGAEYARSEYPELFAAIGTMYGSGDGATTFNVPDLRNRVPAGSSENHPACEMVGEEAHQLTKEELPSDIGTNGMGFLLTDMSAAVAQTAVADGVRNQKGVFLPDAVFKDQPHNNMQPTTYIHGYIIATGKGTGVSVADIIMGAQAIPLGLEYGGVGATDPKTARDNLGITPENIGALSMKLLWENASPSSEFAPQTISLNLAKRSGVIVGFAYYTSLLDGIHRWYEFCPVGEGMASTFTSIGSSGESAVTVRREFSVNGSGVVFGDGEFQQNTVYAPDSKRAIPMKIYAV